MEETYTKNSMKTFGELTWDDAVYCVSEMGVVKKGIIYAIQDNNFNNVVLFTFIDNSKSPRLIKNEKVVVDKRNHELWFANVEDASAYLKEIADTANEVIQNCLTSLKLFN